MSEQRNTIELIQRARAHVSDLAAGRKRFSMQIPANHEQDSDLILCDALDAALAEIRELRSRG